MNNTFIKGKMTSKGLKTKKWNIIITKAIILSWTKTKFNQYNNWTNRTQEIVKKKIGN